MKVVHIAPGLGRGGAESVLQTLVVNAPPGTQSIVVSLTSADAIGESLARDGVRVYAGDTDAGWMPTILWLGCVLKRERPDIVQTWLYKGDLIGGAVARLLGLKVIWGVHHADFAISTNKFTTVVAARFAGILSRLIPDRIVCCSPGTAQVHRHLGYSPAAITVVTNGINTSRFSPERRDRASLVAELGISSDKTLIAFPARYHPIKGHRLFADAAAQLLNKRPNAHFVLFGRGTDNTNTELVGMLDEFGIGPNSISLLGERGDVPRLLASVELVVSCSLGEALPLTIAEAMACGAHVVATRVGDTAYLIGEAGDVVETQPKAMASAWDTALTAASAASTKSINARERVLSHFSEARMVSEYFELYRTEAGR